MQNSEILKYCELNPREYTYIGIGSKNRYDNEKFTKEIDQIFPVFLDKVDTTIRIIHFDPRFEEQEFLKQYFSFRNIRKLDYTTWLSDDHRIEVIINPVYFDDTNFFYEMMKLMIKQKTKLVVQQYTGKELLETFKQLYVLFSHSEKEFIRANILFDFTYGEACHCDTPMLEYEPLIDTFGDFYNFTLLNEKEIYQLIGANSRIDKLIEKYVNSNLSRVLNENHVNYHKALRGESLMFHSTDYDANEKPQVIMNILLKRVQGILDVLNKLGKLSAEKKELFSRYSQNYLSMDVYKWYEQMTKLYK